jgi:hypothetical protein
VAAVCAFATGPYTLMPEARAAIVQASEGAQLIVGLYTEQEDDVPERLRAGRDHRYAQAYTL